MSTPTFTVEVVSPAGGVVINQTVSHLRLPGVEGYFGILAQHADLLAALGTGHLELDGPSGRTVLALSGGYVQVKDGRVMVLAESAESSESLDLDRAKAAHGRASSRLHAPDADQDDLRARASLLRALNRMRLAERAKDF
jgi:F-type H+-transporting ATPase subunit epsilon